MLFPAIAIKFNQRLQNFAKSCHSQAKIIIPSDFFLQRGKGTVMTLAKFLSLAIFQRSVSNVDKSFYLRTIILFYLILSLIFFEIRNQRFLNTTILLTIADNGLDFYDFLCTKIKGKSFFVQWINYLISCLLPQQDFFSNLLPCIIVFTFASILL